MSVTTCLRTAVALYALISMHGISRASTVPLVGPAHYAEYLNDYVQGGTGKSVSIPDTNAPVSLGYFAASNSPRGESFAKATLGITSSPIAAISAYSYAYNIGWEPKATATGVLTYQVEFVGNPGLVLVDVSALGFVSAGGSDSDLVLHASNASTISFMVDGVGIAINQYLRVELDDGITSSKLLRYGSKQSFVANTVYDVTISASTEAEIYNNEVGLWSQEGAYIDPSFVVDPTYSSSYKVEISPGIGNAVSSVPLPSSAPMFGAALLALGAVGYGMKWKGKAAPAA